MEKYCLCGYLCASLDAQFSKFSLRQTNVASPKVDIWVAINQNLTTMITDAPMIRYSVQTVQTGHNKYVSPPPKYLLTYMIVHSKLHSFPFRFLPIVHY